VTKGRRAPGDGLSPCQCMAGVSAHTGANFEGGGALKTGTVEVIQRRLEKAGIIFIDANDAHRARDGGPKAGR
jgi:hypothetical protein